MTFNNTKKIQYTKKNQLLDENQIEYVDKCPYCSSRNFKIAYSGVEDYAFRKVGGKWDFNECLNCSALYLSVRLKEEYIDLAYFGYHEINNKFSIRTHMKLALMSIKTGVNLNENLFFPRVVLEKCSKFFSKRKLPFGWRFINHNNAGNFLDYGCGKGLSLKFAHLNGWNAVGVDLDATSVDICKKQGLNARFGNSDLLNEYNNYFDVIFCFHVIEHLYEPRSTIVKLIKALKKGGVIFFELPNAQSYLRYHFGRYWRGLEAPRHISIPGQHSFIKILEALDVEVEIIEDTYPYTAIESFRLKRGGVRANIKDYILNVFHKLYWSKAKSNDFIKLVARKL